MMILTAPLGDTAVRPTARMSRGCNRDYLRLRDFVGFGRSGAGVADEVE